MTTKKMKCIAFSILFIFILMIGWGCGVYHHYSTIIQEMDRNELHYDADGWFLMVDKGHNLVGLYFATTPVMHQFCDTSKFLQNRNGLDIPAFVYGGEDQTWYEGHTVKGEE